MALSVQFTLSYLAAFMNKVGERCVTFFFQGTFAKLRKVTITFVISVRVEELCPHWTDFDEI